MTLKPCPFCGGKIEVKNMEVEGGTIITYLICENGNLLRRYEYSPGRINKPKNAFETATRRAVEEYNREVNNE